MAPKPYTVKRMEKDPGFAGDVEALMKKYPRWTLRMARLDAARMAFLRSFKMVLVPRENGQAGVVVFQSANK